ncbi:hypothetical protein Tco_0567093 [Tanacetum coccineum]
MARLWDLRTSRRAAFSSFLSSLAIMTGYLSSPSKKCIHRWGAVFLEFNLGGSSRKIQRFYLPEFDGLSLTSADIVLDLVRGVVVHCSKLHSRKKDVPLRILISWISTSDEVGYLLGARNESALQIKKDKSLSPKGVRFGEAVETMAQNMEWVCHSRITLEKS